MIRIISWNIGKRSEPWRELSRSNADSVEEWGTSDHCRLLIEIAP